MGEALVSEVGNWISRGKNEGIGHLRGMWSLHSKKEKNAKCEVEGGRTEDNLQGED